LVAHGNLERARPSRQFQEELSEVLDYSHEALNVVVASRSWPFGHSLTFAFIGMNSFMIDDVAQAVHTQGEQIDLVL
jgi:hypothetical protein